MKHEIFKVVNVNVVAPYTLEIEFSDTTKQVIDFLPVLNGELFEPLRDLSIFNLVKIDEEAHTIIWPNGADFDPATLHDWGLYQSEIINRAQQWDKVAEGCEEYQGSYKD